MNEAQSRLLADANLSDSARVLGLYISTLGDEGGEVPRDEFRRLLHGAVSKDRVARALSELELHGYIERKPGGRDHSDHFRFSVAAVATLKVHSIRAVATVSAPPTTTPTPPPPYVPPQESSGLELVREYLGDEAVAVALAGGPVTAAKLKGIVAMYGPTGTQTDRVMRGLSATERRKALATAVIRMAMDAKQYSNQLFEKYLTRAITGEATNGQHQQRGTGTDGRANRGAPAAHGGEAPRADRGQRIIVE